MALRSGDDGAQYNRVRNFDVIGIDPPEADTFAPVPSSNGQPPKKLPLVATAAPEAGDADDTGDPRDGTEQKADLDASFNPDSF